MTVPRLVRKHEPRARITHELKSWPEFFEQTWNGRMTFELRKNDRDYQVGDQLLLREWEPGRLGRPVTWEAMPRGTPGTPGIPRGYTGREVLVRVDYMMDGTTRFTEGQGVKIPMRPIAPDYVIMSISLVN